MKRTICNGKIKRWAASVCCIAAIVLLSAVQPSAAILETEIGESEENVMPRTSVAQFTKAFVDSNSYTYITQRTQSTAKSYAEVQITNILDAEGNVSDYRSVMVKATVYGTEKRVIVGDTWTQIPIPSDLQFAGMTIPMYAMGHDSSKDCMISGYWMVY